MTANRQNINWIIFANKTVQLVLLKYKERRLDTLKNETLRTTFIIQCVGIKIPILTTSNLQLPRDTTQKHRIGITGH
jgi:hypothetical protein